MGTGAERSFVPGRAEGAQAWGGLRSRTPWSPSPDPMSQTPSWSSRTAVAVLLAGLATALAPLACVEASSSDGGSSGPPPDTGNAVGGVQLELTGDL